MNETVALQAGWYLDPWAMWVHKDNPDGDSFDSLEALIQFLNHETK